MNHKEAWEDLQTRLEKTGKELHGLKKEAYAASELSVGSWCSFFTDEVRRLRAKIEGVELARSYMKEYGELNDH